MKLKVVIEKQILSCSHLKWHIIPFKFLVNFCFNKPVIPVILFVQAPADLYHIKQHFIKPCDDALQDIWWYHSATKIRRHCLRLIYNVINISTGMCMKYLHLSNCVKRRVLLLISFVWVVYKAFLIIKEKYLSQLTILVFNRISTCSSRRVASECSMIWSINSHIT